MTSSAAHPPVGSVFRETGRTIAELLEATAHQVDPCEAYHLVAEGDAGCIRCGAPLPEPEPTP